MGRQQGWRGARPRDVLPLPTATPPPPPPLGHPPRRRAVPAWVVVAGLVLIVLLAAIRPGETPLPDMVTDPATEDAVVAVLLLYTAEVAMADAVATDDVFALPGPITRSTQLAVAAREAHTRLQQLRDDDPAPGTPASAYIADADHDALQAVATQVGRGAALLAQLDQVHATLLTGAATITLEEAQVLLAQVAGAPAGVGEWAAALGRLLAGDRSATDAAVQARAAAGAAWLEEARRIAPAALTPLTSFLNGIDPGVIAALDGHPVAGPALGRLRR